MQPRAFLQALDDDAILRAIRAAEERSSGEIRVHVSSHETTDAQKDAAARFEALGMTKTRERNGVLFYLAPKSRAFAVIGDTAIHERCGPAFWTEIASAMEAAFREGRYTDGLVAGIARAGFALAEHFPRQHDDANELSDEVSRD
jgi:uncharacterized membrane protein